MAGLAEKIFRLHLSQLQRATVRHGIAGFRELYGRSKTSLESRLRANSGSEDGLTPVALRALLLQVDAILGELGDDFEAHLHDTGALAARLGARHGLDEFKLLERHYKGTEPVLDVERAAVFEGLVADTHSSLLRRYQRVSRTWGAQAIGQIEQRLSVSAMTGMGLHEAVGGVVEAGGILDSEWWKGERIVRTEMAYAHGATKHAALERIRDDQAPALQKKLLEMVDDDRVGDDSLLIHGQAVNVDEPFTWKKRVGKGWATEAFMFPPNRPNDRAVVVPWNPDWPESEEERPLSLAELRSAPPTRWRHTPGVDVPPGHVPGRSYLSRGGLTTAKTETRAILPPPAPSAIAEASPPITQEAFADPLPAPKSAARSVAAEAVAVPPELVAGNPPKQAGIVVEQAARRVAATLFGRVLADEDLASLVGMTEGGMRLRAVGERLLIEARKPHVDSEHGRTEIVMDRTIYRNADGQLEIHNDYFKIPKHLRGTKEPGEIGLGAEIFSRQVAHARRLGISKITTSAARSPSMNGYYTWARFGYDGPINKDVAEELGATKVSEIMRTPEGRELWREKGHWFEGTFDLSNDSLSMRTLVAYIHERKTTKR